MMIKSKKVFCVISTFVVLGGLITAVLIDNQKQLREGLFNKTFAVECLHESVEHYEATSEHIEHWACCQCHHAWADVDKTIEISENTTADRSAIDFGLHDYTIAINHSGDWGNWGENVNATHDEQYTFVFSLSDTSVTEAIIQSRSEYRESLPEGKFYYFYITNGTDKSLNAIPYTRAWGSSGMSPILIPAGESRIVSAPASVWNSGAKNGPCVHLAAENGTFSGSITFYPVQIIDSELEMYFNTSIGSFDMWDKIQGLELVNGVPYYSYSTMGGNVSEGFVQSITTSAVTANKWFVSHVINRTNKEITITARSREWDTNGDSFVIPSGGTALVYGNDTLFNTNSKKGVTFRIGGDNYSGNVLFSIPQATDYIPQFTDGGTVGFGYDSIAGYYYSVDSTVSMIKLTKLFEIDTELYSGASIKVYNAGSTAYGNMWSEDWDGEIYSGAGGYGGVYTFSSQQWSDVTINRAGWNGTRSSKELSFYDLRNNWENPGELRIAVVDSFIAL